MSGKVCIGYIRGEMVHGAFMESVLRAIAMPPHHIGGQFHQVTSRLAAGRNDVVKLMLADESYEWLWMLDTDAVFPPDLLNRMLAAADPVERPVLGALCFGGLPYGPVRPTIYMYDREDPDAKPRLVGMMDFPPDTLIRVHATGAHCLLIHRRVLEDIATRFGERSAYPWFEDTELELDGVLHPAGEDISFCLRAQLSGHTVWVHTGIECGHLKTASIDTEAFLRWRALQEVEAALAAAADEPAIQTPTLEQVEHVAAVRA